MNGTTQLRFVDEVVGGFVLACILLFVAAIVLAGRAQGWFEKDFELLTVFPPKGALDLHQGSEVRIQGAIAGRVGDIVPNASGALQTTYILRGRFRDLVRTNSVAVVKKKFQVAGDAFVEITLGDRRFPLMEDGTRIPSVEDVQLVEKIAEALEEVRRTVVPMLEEVQGILANVNGILSTVQEGKGVVGNLLHDEVLAGRLNTITEEIEKTAPKVPALADKMTDVATQLESLTVDMRKLADKTSRKVDETDVRQVLTEAETTLRDSRRLIEAATRKINETDVTPVLRETEATLRETRHLMENLQQHWFLRKKDQDTGKGAGGEPMDPVSIPTGEGTP
jgi:phospholipid/cholesterol/gamma-HCH transport system substrate-binding protein